MKKLLAKIKLINSGKVVANNKVSFLFRASNYQGDSSTPEIGYVRVYQNASTKKYTIWGSVNQFNLDSIPASLTYNFVSFDEITDFQGKYPVYAIREVVTLDNGKTAFLYDEHASADLLQFGDKLSIGQDSYAPLLWDIDLRETYFRLNGKAVKGINAIQITDDFPDLPLPATAYDDGVYSNNYYEHTNQQASMNISFLFPFIYDSSKAHAYLFKAKLKTSNELFTCGFNMSAMPTNPEEMPYMEQKGYDVRFTGDGHIVAKLQGLTITSEKTFELNTLYWFFISFNENYSCCYLYVKEASETDQIENVTFDDPVFVLEGLAEPVGDYQDIYSDVFLQDVLGQNYAVQLPNTAVSTSLNPYKFYFPAGSGDPVKAKLTRSDLTPPNKYYISIGSTPATASITITNTLDSTKTTTATGQASLFLNDGESATVNVSLDGYTTVEKTITIDGANHKEMITLEDNVVTFTINPTPSDATVTINNVVQNSVEVEKGSTVTWSVEKTGYVTQSGEEAVNEDTTKEVTLEEETPRYSFTMSATPNTATITLADGSNTITGTGTATLSNIPEGNEVSYTVSASGYITQSGTEVVTSDVSKSIELEVETFTLTINPTPADATVTLTAEGYTQSGNSITVPSGTSVQWSVTAEGYTTQSGTQIVSSDLTLPITLESSTVETHTLSVLTEPADANIEISGDYEEI